MLLRLTAAAALACAFALASPTAEARPKHHRHDSREARGCAHKSSGRHSCRGRIARIQRHGRRAGGHDPKPRAWCGWWMRRQLNVADRRGNLARWWAGYGTNAHGPAVGAIVVWPNHVGLITGRTARGFIVKSGNDGHAVRERERSLRGAIAFRWPNRMDSR